MNRTQIQNLLRSHFPAIMTPAELKEIAKDVREALRTGSTQADVANLLVGHGMTPGEAALCAAQAYAAWQAANPVVPAIRPAGALVPPAPIAGPPGPAGRPAPLGWLIAAVVLGVLAIGTAVWLSLAMSGSTKAEKAQVAALETRVTTLDQQAGAAITAVNTKLGTLDTRLATAEGNLATLDSSVAALDTKVSGIDSRLTTSEAGLTNLTGTVAALDSRLTTAEGNLTAFGAAASTASADAAAATARANAAYARLGKLRRDLIVAKALPLPTTAKPVVVPAPVPTLMPSASLEVKVR